jgi:cell division protein FtsW (lipid II flippase)
VSIINPDRIQFRLLLFAGIFITFYAIALTVAPSVRGADWNVELRWAHWFGWLIWVIGFIIAHRESTHRLPNRDPFLIPIAALLSGWGMLAIWRLYPYFGIRQTVWFFIALVIFIIGIRLPSDLKYLRRYKYLWLTGGLILTSLTLILGTNPSGADGPRLWLGCCGIYLQPSEPLKLLLVIYLSAYLADRLWVPSADPNNPLAPRMFPLLAPTLIMTGLALALLFIQKDLGTATIFLFLFASVIYFSTGRKQVILVTLLALLSAGLIGYQLFDIVKIRIDAWLNPWIDPSGNSYQIIQSLMAFANGGIPGRGPGLGSPSLVPVPHSDFIFATIAEESGFIGICILLLVLGLLLERGIVIALKATDTFRRYLAAGLTFFLIAQSILIIGGNLRLLPLTGVTLPFVSYGGSSLLTSFISLLLLLLISYTDETKPATLSNPKPYIYIGIFLFLGLVANMILAAWWTTMRSSQLAERTDNARRSISDRFVMRGQLYDRFGNMISTSEGSPGNYQRKLLYPEMSNVIGYTHPIYGQSGLEAALDPYLRGLKGNASSLVETHYLLYGIPPPGIDIRLSLDLEKTKLANSLLENHKGAVVLINAESGEILSLASHPTFSIDQLDAGSDSLLNDPNTPLLNRATQGFYPAGSSIAPLLFAELTSKNLLQPDISQIQQISETTSNCAFSPTSSDFSALLKAGCTSAFVALTEQFDQATLFDFLTRLGFFNSPDFILPVAYTEKPDKNVDISGFLLNNLFHTTSSNIVINETDSLQPTLKLSPFQLSLATAALMNSGKQPTPSLVLAMNIPDIGWILQTDETRTIPIFPSLTNNQILDGFIVPGTNDWGIVSVVPNGPAKYVTWFVGGNYQEDGGDPNAVVVLLEENNPSLALSIGKQLLETNPE